MKLKTSVFTFEGLIEHIETHFEDEKLQSNYWENKYNVTTLEELLSDSIIIVDGIAFISLQDGLYAVDFETEETPCMQSSIRLFELDSISEVSKEFLKERVEKKQAEMIQLQILLTYFTK